MDPGCWLAKFRDKSSATLRKMQFAVVLIVTTRSYHCRQPIKVSKKKIIDCSYEGGLKYTLL